MGRCALPIKRANQHGPGTRTVQGRALAAREYAADLRNLAGWADESRDHSIFPPPYRKPRVAFTNGAGLSRHLSNRSWVELLRRARQYSADPALPATQGRRRPNGGHGPQRAAGLLAVHRPS